MNLKDLYHLEIEGISKTIRSYAVDHFTQSYSKQLLELNIANNQEIIQEIISRLIEWYDTNYESIMQSKFVINKQEHQKSYRLLLELQQLLNNNIAG